MPGSLDVVIVSYRSADLLRECLASLRRHGEGLNVHVIDNASGDGSAELVAAEFPEVRLTANAANRGFAAASNQGISSGSAPWVLLLNPDAQIREGTLPTLLAALEADRASGRRRAQARASRRRARSRRQALVPDGGGSARLLHPARPGRARGAAVHRARGRGGAGRRDQRRVHADPPRCARRSRAVRRGLLDVHGGPRPLLPLQGRGLARPLRAARGCVPPQGRQRRAPPRARG